VAVVSADAATIAGLAPRPTLKPVPALLYWRTRRALAQRELADLVSVDITTVQRLERGASARLATVRKLAAALQVAPSDLMDPPPAD
jgi:transcriptional regulator with XRE-family HTH domain